MSKFSGEVLKLEYSNLVQIYMLLMGCCIVVSKLGSMLLLFYLFIHLKFRKENGETLFTSDLEGQVSGPSGEFEAICIFGSLKRIYKERY